MHILKLLKYFNSTSQDVRGVLALSKSHFRMMLSSPSSFNVSLHTYVRMYINIYTVLLGLRLARVEGFMVHFLHVRMF